MDYKKIHELITYIGNAWKVYWLKELYNIFWRRFCDKHIKGLLNDNILRMRKKGDSNWNGYRYSYELHFEYRNAIQAMAKNIANWYTNQDKIDITFDADKDVHIRINNDVYHYTPEDWMRKNDNKIHSYWEWQKISNHHKNVSLWKEVRIRNKFDNDLQEKFVSMVWEIKQEQRSRDQQELDRIRE